MLIQPFKNLLHIYTCNEYPIYSVTILYYAHLSYCAIIRSMFGLVFQNHNTVSETFGRSKFSASTNLAKISQNVSKIANRIDGLPISLAQSNKQIKSHYSVYLSSKWFKSSKKKI